MTRQAFRALRARGREAKQMVRVTVAALVAFVLYHLFSLPQGYWAVFTVVIVMQSSIGGTLAASVDRMKGTLFGAAVGGVCAALHPHTPLGLGVAMALAVAVTVFAAAATPSLKVAPVTAVIMLISPVGSSQGPLMAAALRVVEIAIGSFVGVLASALIFPSRSGRLAAAAASDALLALGDTLDRYALSLQTGPDERDQFHAQTRIRSNLAAVETAMEDAEREHASRLGGNRLSKALPRTLWRVRNDVVSISRALGPLPEGAAQALAAPIKSLMMCQAQFMRACAEGLTAEALVQRGDPQSPLERFEAAMALVRSSRVTHTLDFDDVGRLFGLGFALESLQRNLGDLADRIDEAARTREL